MCGLRYGGFHRPGGGGPGKPGVTAITSINRIDGFAPPQMNHCQGSARAMRSKLLSKDTVFSRRNRYVVNPAGGQGNIIPVSNPTGWIILMPWRIRLKPEQVPRCLPFLIQRAERLL